MPDDAGGDGVPVFLMGLDALVLVESVHAGVAARPAAQGSGICDDLFQSRDCFASGRRTLQSCEADETVCWKMAVSCSPRTKISWSATVYLLRLFGSILPRDDS